MEDSKIVELYFARDELAVIETQTKYGQLLKKLAERILGDSHDAEECLNDCYLGIWGSIPPEQPENLRAYCCRIIRNLSFKRLEYNLAEKRSPKSKVPLDDLEASLATECSDFNSVDFSIAINDFLGELNPDQRAVFLKRYFFFDTVPEIARDLGMSEGKVRSLVSKTKSKFKSHLSKKE